MCSDRIPTYVGFRRSPDTLVIEGPIVNDESPEKLCEHWQEEEEKHQTDKTTNAGTNYIPAEPTSTTKSRQKDPRLSADMVELIIDAAERGIEIPVVGTVNVQNEDCSLI